MDSRQIIGLIIIIALMLGYIFLFVYNRKTKIPEGCEEIEEKIRQNCSACSNELCEYKRRSSDKNE